MGITAEKAAKEINWFRGQHNQEARVTEVDPMEMTSILRKHGFGAIPVSLPHRHPELCMWALSLPQNIPILVRAGQHYRVLYAGNVTCALHNEGLELGPWVTDRVDEAWIIWHSVAA